MMNKIQGLSVSTNDLPSSSSYSPIINMHCKQLLSLANKTADLNAEQLLPIGIQELFTKTKLTFRLPKTMPECLRDLTRLVNDADESNTTIPIDRRLYGVQGHSHSLIIFVVLIALVSLISVIGNLCLAKVLYSKRYRLIQTDRIVLCLALSELCLVLIDTPAEIYRFLSYSFTQEWLCRFHTFFEALFSSCIIFYHLLGAFDRFVYIHGHTSSDTSAWSKWCRRISTKSGSIILLLLPIVCSLPIAICNCLHANISRPSNTIKTCLIHYTDGLLIGLLISFYALPLLFSFFFHAKLIYFIRTRHSQEYYSKATYMLTMNRSNTLESQSISSRKRSSHKQNIHFQDQSLLQSRTSHRRFVMTNTGPIAKTNGSTTTTTTMGAVKSLPFNNNNNSNSSQSSRSSTGTSSTSTTLPIVLYKINSQANANANRTVLLLVLLLSFYVFCWAPYNVYTWHLAYQATHSSLSKSNQTLPNRSSINDFTAWLNINQTIPAFLNSSQTITALPVLNLKADLRRIIFINYALYLLSMVSMCFSFIFYFSLNKQARHEFSRCIGCICPWSNSIRNEKQKQKQKVIKYEQVQPRRLHYHARYQQKYPYNNERIKVLPTPVVTDRYNYMKRMNNSQNGMSKRKVLDYGCQIQCCP